MQGWSMEYVQSITRPSRLQSTKGKLSPKRDAINQGKTKSQVGCKQPRKTKYRLQSTKENLVQSGLQSTKKKRSPKWASINQGLTTPQVGCNQPRVNYIPSGLQSTKEKLSPKLASINQG